MTGSYVLGSSHYTRTKMPGRWGDVIGAIIACAIWFAIGWMVGEAT